MSQVTDPRTHEGDGRPARNAVTATRVVRACATAITIVIVVQAALAGGALDGNPDLIPIHGAIGVLLVLGLSLTAMIAAMRARRRGGSWVVIAVCVVGFLAVTAQAGLGYTRVLAAHFPLGVAIGLTYAGLSVHVGRGLRTRAGMGALLALTALPLLLAACASEGGGANAPSPPPVAGARSDVVTVYVRDMAFEPALVEIEAGTTVQWVWDDAPMPHDVAGDGFKSDVQTTGTFAFTFENPGTYDYLCTLHPQMTGAVTVVEAP